MIEYSVGQGGFNYDPEVKFIQGLFKEGIYGGNQSLIQPLIQLPFKSYLYPVCWIDSKGIVVNGMIDQFLIQAIKDYQKKIGVPNPDGRIDPKGKTISALLNDESVKGKEFFKKLCNELSTARIFQQNISNPILNGKMRGHDDHGDGYFGAPRGSHTHQGIDVEVKAGENVLSPIDGKIERVAYPYASDLSYKGAIISGIGKHKEYAVTLFYMSLKEGLVKKKVLESDVIGSAQDIAKKYSTPKKQMTNHVHIEVRKKGSLLDPSGLIAGLSK